MTAATTVTPQYKMFPILPALYLSGFPPSIPQNITHILNMCHQPHSLSTITNLIHKHIAIDDIDDITPHIDTITTFIDSALQNNGSVLVHCAMGMNRSVAAVIAYLCYKEEITAAEALRLVVEKKGDVRPSMLFLGQIDRAFRRVVEDPLVGFQRRLEERKRGGRGSGERMEED